VPSDVVDVVEPWGERGARGGAPGLDLMGAVLLAVVCIALTPLWNWLFKLIRGTSENHHDSHPMTWCCIHMPKAFMGAVLLAMVCIALTPLWNRLFKLIRGRIDGQE
jgi:hypothetical protein